MFWSSLWTGFALGIVTSLVAINFILGSTCVRSGVHFAFLKMEGPMKATATDPASIILTEAIIRNHGNVSNRSTRPPIVHERSRNISNPSTRPPSVHKRSRPRILCWIMTHPGNLDTKATAALKTWGRRCDITLLANDVLNTSLRHMPMMNINVTHGREHLTDKTYQALDYLHAHYADRADWFLKADDDTYVIVENLRHLVSSLDTNEPVIIGQHFHVEHYGVDYPSGGAGYVLSRAALRRFGGRAPGACAAKTGPEDVRVGMCAVQELGVRFVSSLDAAGRSRFHCLDLPGLHGTRRPDWLLDRDPQAAHGANQSLAAVSPHAITFHYVRPDVMYAMDYLLYTLHHTHG